MSVRSLEQAAQEKGVGNGSVANETDHVERQIKREKLMAFSSRDDMECMEHSSTALLKLMILYTGVGYLRESLEVPKGSQATCSV